MLQIAPDLAKRTLITKTYRQLNHELPIMLYKPLELDKRTMWHNWLIDESISTELKKNLSLYIHIPYCTQICSFCYLEKRLLDGTVPTFMDQLIQEIKLLAPVFKNTQIKTIYLGGGTPGALSTIQLNRLFTTLYQSLNLEDVEEFSLETDLPSLTEDKLRCYLDHGLTRLSVGLQNLDPSVLKQNNRRHKYDMEMKLSFLEKHRFRDLNLDVILGIPGSCTENVSSTLSRALELSPSRISLYTFNPFTDYDFDFSCDSSIKSLVDGRKSQQSLAKSILNRAKDEGQLPDRDNMQLEDTMKNHAPLLGLGPSANNRLPFHVYYKNPNSNQYLSEPNSVTGWYSSGIQDELEIHMYNCIIRNYPIDLRQTRKLFNLKPSWIHSFVTQRLNGLILEDGLLKIQNEDTISANLELLRNLELTKNTLSDLDFPSHLEGIDEDKLLEILIGY